MRKVPVAMTVGAMVIAVAVVAAVAAAKVYRKIVIGDVVIRDIHSKDRGKKRETTIDPREGGVEVSPLLHHHRRHQHRPLLPK